MVSDYYYYYYLIIFVQGIYNYVHETTHVSRVCSVATVLYLQFVLHVMSLRPQKNCLYFYIRTCAVPNMAVFVVLYFRAFLVCCSGII